MCKLQIILFVVICCIAYGSTRPTTEDGSRKVSKHDRSSAARRHADVNISSHVARKMHERRRMKMLARLIAAAEDGKNISVERVMQTEPINSIYVKRKLEAKGLKGIIGYQVLPDKSSIPSHKDTSERLLSHLNGAKRDDNLRVRVVDQRPVTAPRHINEFINLADSLRQQAAMAKTCLELQKTILKLPSVRIKVKCKTTSPSRSTPVAKSFPKPQALMSHGYTAYRSNRRSYINGRGRNRHGGLNRRHTPYRRYYRG
ncbi:uncharacterized protein LOC120328932 isoform X1 [Styela clava]